MEFTELRPGTSVEGEEIKAYRSSTKSENYIYLIAGTHGDEVEGVYVLQQLFDWLKNTDELEFALIVIPILNVDGYRSGTRVNAHGVDLNRNYPDSSWSPEFKEDKYNPGPKALSEPENKFLDKLFEKFPPRIVLSFHSWKPIINYNGPCKKIAEFIERHNNYSIADDIGYETPGSLGSYVPSKYKAPVITYECPLISNDRGLKDIWEENRAPLESLFRSDLLKQTRFQ